ncbi:MAG TPA: hypothetical protein VKM55_09465 [Candidatus Lokiarchaeia archaeon]|nr:hypothetical protein [Candidatus Lokiarchaeia archaeon]
MLEAILSFMPIWILFVGAMVSLVIDLNKVASKFLLMVLPAVSLLFALTQMFPLTESLPNHNLVASPGNAFMVMACMAVTCIIIVNCVSDFKDKNVERFYYVLVFLIAGSICGVLYADNLFLVGLFILITEIFISILKFIYPSIDKKMFNALIAIFTAGFMGIVIGCLIIYNTNPGVDDANLYLTTINTSVITPIALFFLDAGFLFVFAAFPVSLLVHFGLHMKSHASVKVFNVFFMCVLYWKYLSIYQMLRYNWSSFAVVNFILGMANICTGISAIGRELLSNKARRIEMFVLASFIIDFGIILALFGVLDNTALINDAGGIMHTIETAIMLQVLVTLVTKILFILSVKNLVHIFQSDTIDNMEGLKISKPITLLGYVMGTTGTIYLGIFVLDILFQVVATISESLMAWILFVAVFAVLLFTATWIAISIAWIFGGKDLPSAVKNVKTNLKKENVTITVMIAFNAILVAVLLLMPSTSFLAFMIPAA